MGQKVSINGKIMDKIDAKWAAKKLPDLRPGQKVNYILTSWLESD